MKSGLTILWLLLYWSLFISSTLAQTDQPDPLQAPLNVTAGSLTTGLVSVTLINGAPRYVSSFSVYLASTPIAGRLGLGSEFLHADCRNFPGISYFELQYHTAEYRRLTTLRLPLKEHLNL
jgi:hypothetical protein